MGWGSKRQAASLTADNIENVLGKSLRVKGDLKAEGAFRIDGTVEGRSSRRQQSSSAKAAWSRGT